MTLQAQSLIELNDDYLSYRQGRLLTALRTAGLRGLTTRQLIASGGTEATRRVRELRAAGYPIVAFRETSRRWRYTLLSQ